MMIKIAGSIIIILSSAFLGYFLSLECRKRPQQLRELQSLLMMFENQISYLSDILSEAFERVYRCSRSEVGNFFSHTIEKLKQGTGIDAATAWEQSVRENLGKTALNSEDAEIILSFGELLGSSDIDGQIKNIRLAVSQLKLQEEKAEESRAKYEGMYKNLGILGGFALVVILL